MVYQQLKPNKIKKQTESLLLDFQNSEGLNSRNPELNTDFMDRLCLMFYSFLLL